MVYFGYFWSLSEVVIMSCRYIENNFENLLKILVFFEEPLYLKTWMYDAIYTAVQKFEIFKKLMTCYIHKKWL